jgi:group I intron endonuclease
MYGIIYKITNKSNGLAYIGQTTNSLSCRLKQHLSSDRKRHITNVLRKYGIESFSVEVLVSCLDKAALNAAEVYFVEKFNTMYPNGYNHRAGGEQNGVCSVELKKKISLAKTGKPNLLRRGEVRSQEQRLKISRTLGGQNIVARNLQTGEIKIYPTAHATRKDGHNPSNVVQICKNSSGRKISKGWTFFYENSYYANQSGSSLGKTIEHAQRIGLETASAE